MNEHLFTTDEKRKQLEDFIHAIKILNAHTAAKEHYSEFVEEYQKLLNQASVLVHQGFSQEDCTKLARQFQPFLYTYRDWEPPFPRDQSGKLEIPTWYPEVEKLHTQLVNVVDKLQSIGHY